MIVVGVSSGTSADGIDTAVAELTLDGDTIRLAPVAHRVHPYSPGLRRAIVEAYPPARITAQDVCRIDTGVGQECAEAVLRAVEDAGVTADLVCSHGQTIYHWAERGVVHGTLQLGQPAWIAEAVGAPVVSDVRSADIAAGGQGAPLAVVLDALLLADRDAPSVALNIGGIANVTVRRADGEVLAFDTGPGNALLDAAVSTATSGQETHDANGERAARGEVDEKLLAVLLDEPYYRLDAPKSTGKELFDPTYLARAVARAPARSSDDVIATLTELTAITIADAVRPYGVRHVYVSGGGIHNPVLMRRLAHHLQPAFLRSAVDLGLDVDGKEAYLFALLGFLTWHGIPASLPNTTGARRATLTGRITPGHGPLRMPEPALKTPSSLVLTTRDI